MISFNTSPIHFVKHILPYPVSAVHSLSSSSSSFLYSPLPRPPSPTSYKSAEGTITHSNSLTQTGHRVYVVVSKFLLLNDVYYSDSLAYFIGVGNKTRGRDGATPFTDSPMSSKPPTPRPRRTMPHSKHGHKKFPSSFIPFNTHPLTPPGPLLTPFPRPAQTNPIFFDPFPV